MNQAMPAWPVEKWTPRGWSEPIDRKIPADRLADLAVAWPWPYTIDHLTNIGADFPAARRAQALREIVLIGRRSVIARAARRLTSPQREDPRAEIERLRSALEGLSVDAWRLLDLFDFQQGRLLSSIYAIEMSLPEAKPRTERGGAPKSRDATTVAAFRSVYEQAFDGKIPKRGYPDFQKACIGPLGFDLYLDESARRHQRRTVKK